MPFYPNGTWYNWGTYTQSAVNSINNGTSDPVSAVLHSATNANPTLMPIFTGALYVFLWVKFANAPSPFKLVGITALVLVISVIMAAGGFISDAVLNFVAFIMAYFISLLFPKT